MADEGAVLSVDFSSFYRKYRLYVFDLSRKRLAREEDARDLAATVWAEVFQHFDRFQGGDPRRILAQLVTWRARDVYRQQYRGQSHKVECLAEDQYLVDLLEQLQPSKSPEDGLALQQVLLEEPEIERKLLFGRFVEGLSWEELSSRHSLHRNTLLKRVKSSLARLRLKLEAPMPMEQTS